MLSVPRGHESHRVPPPLGDLRSPRLTAALLHERFPSADVLHRRQSRGDAQTCPAGSDHFREPHLRETAPVELIEPDAGGSTEAMRSLNGAIAAIREEVAR